MAPALKAMPQPLEQKGGAEELGSPASLKRNRGAVLRFGKMLGRNATPKDLTEDQIDRYAEDMTARDPADWRVDRDRMTLQMLARFLAGE